MRIAFLTKEFTKAQRNILIAGGSAYYRAQMPHLFTKYESSFGLPAWTSDRGFGVKESPRTARFGFDVVMLKLIMDRWVPHQIEVAQKLGQKIVVDVDDHYEGLHEDNLAFKMTDPSFNKVSNREHYQKIIELADVVTVTTPFLYEYYKPRVKRVVMIRNAVRVEQFPNPRKHRSTPPLLGWAGAMQWRSNDAETADPWLQDFLAENDLKFHHAGHMPNTPVFADKAKVDPQRMVLSPMKPFTEYVSMLNFDIGLVLLSDVDFNEAKSNLKGLEYAMANIPFVAYASGEYEHLANDGIGRVARTPDEWKKHLTDLLDYKVRKREAAVNRHLVIEKYSMDRRAVEWNNLFASLE